jgi:4-hydroxyphenylpyruvate dioxygenase
VTALDFAAIELWVGNARHASSYLTNALGFALIGVDRADGTVSYRLAQGGVSMVVTGATRRDSPVADFVRRHGDGVRDIVLTATDGSGTTTGFGDTVHTLVEAGPPDTGPVGVGLTAIDHVAVSVAPGDRDRCVARYEDELGFERFGESVELVDIGDSAFTMSSVRAGGGSATFVFAEPADGPSQIADFLREYDGPGVHHLAFATSDIVHAATALRARGVATLPVPGGYYEQARARVGRLDLPWDALQDLGILVDRDQDGVLLQAFTDPIGDRPTLYFEIIQRIGSTGFGTDNVRALYHAVVLHHAPSPARRP